MLPAVGPSGAEDQDHANYTDRQDRADRNGSSSASLGLDDDLFAGFGEPNEEDE
jgi:hypothetical protein